MACNLADFTILTCGVVATLGLAIAWLGLGVAGVMDAIAEANS